MPYSANDFQNRPLGELLREAAEKRDASFGSNVELDAIINIKSGQCPMDCRFCAQSGHYKTAAPVFPLIDKKQLVETTQKTWASGVHRVGWVASGCSVDEQGIDALCEAADELSSSLTPNPHSSKKGLCASLGQLPKESLQRLKDAGFTRFHHNLETSETYYPSICSTQRWRDRYKTVCHVKETGLETCSGVLFGLGETWQDRLDLATVLRDLEVNSIPVNFLNPVKGTPFESREKISAEEALRIIAMLRIICENATVRVCGGRQTSLQNRQSEIFEAGANGLMTGDFLTTAGTAIQDDLTMIQHCGLTPRLTPVK